MAFKNDIDKHLPQRISRGNWEWVSAKLAGKGAVLTYHLFSSKVTSTRDTTWNTST